MKKRFMFVYFMKNDPDGVRAAVPGHITYWHNLRPTDYLGGPFADKSGGLITFAADNMDEAEGIVKNDPPDK